MPRKTPTGPIGYMIEQRDKEIAALKEQVEILRAAAKASVSEFTHKQAIRDAVRLAYDQGRKDGWYAGALAALCPVDPDHSKAVAVWESA